MRPPIPSRGDIALAAALLAFFLAEIAAEQRFDGDRPVSVVAAVALCAALLWRRQAPLLAVGAGVGVIVASNAAAPALGDTGAFLLAFVVALYSLGRHARGRAAQAGGLLLAAAVPLAATEPGEDFLVGDLAFIGLLFAGPWAAGVVLRRRHDQEHALEDRAAARAVADERARIARELHDVVSHAISLIVLQARGGRRVLETRPGETRAALDAIEHAGAQALGEMRRHARASARAGRRRHARAAPEPARPRRRRRAGPRDRAARGRRRQGEPVDLPPGIDISAYRIVQEGLTNALKHAGPAHARLVVRYAPDALEVQVVDDGAGGGNGDGSGLGLAGLRERVAVYGGVLEAGARPQGGLCAAGAVAARDAAMIRVLLADDERLVRTGLRMILSAEHDLEVVGEAADGHEAIAGAARWRPDVVVMDIRMPGLDGIEATRRIVEGDAGPRVLVLTTFDLDAYVYEALSAGAGGFLLKDAPEDQLLAAVRVVAGGGALFAPAVTRRLIERFAQHAAPRVAPHGRARRAHGARARRARAAGPWPVQRGDRRRAGRQRAHGQDARGQRAAEARPAQSRPGRRARLRVGRRATGRMSYSGARFTCSQV